MADSKGKYQPWGHEEFMADVRVRRMTPTALKTYMMLLHEAFVCEVRPNLPDDEEELELMAYCTDHEEWLSVRDTVLGMFTRDSIDGVQVLTRKRLQDDWNKIQEIREARSEAGKEGAKARWNGKNSKPMANNGNPIAKNSKEVSKEVKEEREEKEESNSDSLSDFENPDNGQGEEMKLKDELTRIAANHGAKAGGYKTTWDEIKSLGIAHGTGAVSTDFTAFMEEYHGDDFPKGAVVAYLRYAPDRLVADSAPAAVVSKDPQVTGLVREFTYLSGNKVMFQGRQKVALAELLKEYTPEELTAVLKTYLDSRDLEDPYTLKFVTQNYLDAADGLAYSARRQKQEAEEAKTQRDAAVVKMQEQAELERKQAEEKKAKEAEVFDPLADLLSETDQTVV